jgi:hypothetical protein
MVFSSPRATRRMGYPTLCELDDNWPSGFYFQKKKTR